jgi:hypothetical protein
MFLQNFVKNTEVVMLPSPTYQELTKHIDSRSVAFKLRKSGSWQSKRICEKTVRGLKQSLCRLYNVEEDVFVFKTVNDDITVDVKDSLSAPAPYVPGQDLTSLQVVSLINAFIDQVIYFIDIFYPKIGFC